MWVDSCELILGGILIVQQYLTIVPYKYSINFNPYIQKDLYQIGKY